DSRQDFSGFQSTAGDPFAIARGMQPDISRHTAMLRWNEFPIFDLLYVTTTVVASSGHRYTPMVAGDVNGDGAINDRAFIPDPAAMSDTASAAALRSILANGSPGARACLHRQSGTIGSRASCQGPMTFTSALGIK